MSKPLSPVKSRVEAIDRPRGKPATAIEQPAFNQVFRDRTTAEQLWRIKCRYRVQDTIDTLPTSRSRESSAHIQIWRSHTMRRTAIMFAGFIILLTVGAPAQENRSEISLQGTGFFTKDSDGQGIARTTTNTGGFLIGYRYHVKRWLSAEANYGFERNTQRYFSGGGLARGQSDVHAD